MRVSLKFFLFVVVSLFLIKGTYFDVYFRNQPDEVILRPALAVADYKIWKRFDAANLCNREQLPQEDIAAAFTVFLTPDINVVYLTNTNLNNCARNLPLIAEYLHIQDIRVAISLENSIEYNSIFGENFSNYNPAEYVKRFEPSRTVNGWLDYLVVDNGMEYLTYEERRGLQSYLRDYFPNVLIGFRYTKHYLLEAGNAHPNRPEVLIENFLPKEDDGDFIISPIEGFKFKRTRVFIESNQKVDYINNDGQLLN